MATRGVLWTPGSAARGLLNWAIDLWHYVNGKALFNGLKLQDMDAAEMLDVIHFLFEEDMRYSTAEEVQAQSKFRTSFYRLYGKEYRYGSDSSAGTTYGGRTYVPAGGIDEFDPSPVDVRKPYVAPTNFNPESANPFGSVLDAPLG